MIGVWSYVTIGVGMLFHACYLYVMSYLLCGCFVMIGVWMLCHDWCWDVMS